MLPTFANNNFMDIVIRASDSQKQILSTKKCSESATIIWFVDAVVDADVYIDLLFSDENSVFKNVTNKPVIVNAVIETCNELPQNFCRVNAWNTWLEKDKLEVCVPNDETKEVIEKVFNLIGYQVWFVNDIVGMISARSIAMIINEAYFGLEDEISTKEQIDIAMKLGTNYPFGPFEWAEKIGLKNIANLLVKLIKSDDRYVPSQLLIKEAN
jgi:3-hydroxybutyryl-CoA dehydrogenase